MLGTPVALGSNGTNANGTTVTYTVPAGGIPADSTVFVGFSHNAAGSTQSATCADSLGNNYSIASIGSSNGKAGAGLFYFYTAAGIAAGTVITVTHSFSGAIDRSIVAAYCAGQATIDRTKDNFDNNQTAWTTGATATTSSADELAVGVTGHQSAANNSNLTGSSPAMTEVVDNSTVRSCVMYFANAIGSGVAVTGAGNYGGSGNYTAVLATFTGSPVVTNKFMKTA